MKWHKRYLDLAEHISTWSKDPSTKCGAVIVGKAQQILSVGYNGFPRGIDDHELRLNDRKFKYELMVHAEMNAIFNAAKSGICLEGTEIYVHGLPMCSECAKSIIQAGIVGVIMRNYQNTDKGERWKSSCQNARSMLNEAGVGVTII